MRSHLGHAVRGLMRFLKQASRRRVLLALAFSAQGVLAQQPSTGATQDLRVEAFDTGLYLATPAGRPPGFNRADVLLVRCGLDERVKERPVADAASAVAAPPRCFEYFDSGRILDAEIVQVEKKQELCGRRTHRP